MNGPHALGLLAGLGAAACWALASLLYRRVGTVFSPLQLNLWKGVVASLVLGAWLWITPAAAPALPGSLWGLLLLSGALGIGLGDSAYFAALNRLGERHTILVAETLAPLFTLLLAGFWLREWPGPARLLGVAAILGSLMLALGGTQGRDRSTDPAWRAGLVWALVAAICQAGGAVMTRQVFLAVPADAAMTSVLRLLAGILLLLLILPLRRQRLWPASRPGRRTLTLLLGGTLLGTVGGILLQQLAFKYTQAALAQTALATSVILVMVFQAIGGGRVPVRAWLGGLVAVAGVFLLLAGPA